MKRQCILFTPILGAKIKVCLIVGYRKCSTSFSHHIKFVIQTDALNLLCWNESKSFPVASPGCIAYKRFVNPVVKVKGIFC
jgi:hypothetical protein